MKKRPIKEFERKTGKAGMTAQMAVESRLRTLQWLKNGCNGFDMKKPISNPMGFWTEQDVLRYIKENNLPIASVYGSVVYEKDGHYYEQTIDGKGKLTTTGGKRTGCVFCGFGLQREHKKYGKSRLENLKEIAPKQYEYCLGGGEYVDGVWQPNKKGLGFKHIYDECNKIYGDDFIKY